MDAKVTGEKLSGYGIFTVSKYNSIDYLLITKGKRHLYRWISKQRYREREEVGRERERYR